ncbi:MAG: amidohydrolase family protein [Acidobacteriota bacterium]
MSDRLMRWKRYIALGPVLSSALIIACLHGASQGHDAGILVLVNGTLVDGAGADPLPDAVLVVKGNRIQAVGARGAVPMPQPGRIVDVGGATILPGFINAHVHDAYNPQNLEAWALAGVTTVRDEGILLGYASLQELLARRDNEWNRPQYARLVSSGWMITAPEGYGRLFVSSPADARRKVLDELDQGADLIKFSLEDGYGPRSDLPILSSEEVTAIVVAAHERGALVSAHITEATYLQKVVDAGVDDVAHVAWDPVSDELMQRMVEKDIFVLPTLTVMEAYGVLSGSQANLQRFVAMGGQVALGNDYTDVPQNGFDHFELGMPMHEIGRMSEAGMTPMQVIVAATKNASHVCSLEKELGTLEAGKLADVLVVHGDPLADIHALAHVRLVLKGGVVIRDDPTPALSDASGPQPTALPAVRPARQHRAATEPLGSKIGGGRR